MKHFLLFGLICIARMAIAQNVGIGTNTPKAPLQIVGTQTVSLAKAGYLQLGDSAAYNLGLDYYQLQARYNGSYTSLYLNNWGGTTYAGNSSYSYYGLVGYGSNYGVYGTSSSYGVYGSGNYGVYGSGSTYGVYGSAYTLDKSGVYGNGTYAFGVAGNSANNYGGYFTSTNLHGIYAKTSNTSPSAYAAVFQGNTYCYGVYSTSDERVKKNITDFTTGMVVINQLRPKTYEFSNEGNYANLNLPKGAHFGFLAQDVEKLFPALVAEAPLEVQKPPANNISGNERSAISDTAALQKQAAIPIETMQVKAINYTELIPVMVQGMQELDAENKSLKKELSDMHNEVAHLKQLVQDLSVKVNSVK